MFLPKAFTNVDPLFFTITLAADSLATRICSHILIWYRKRYVEGYGDISEDLSRRCLRGLILEYITFL